jgi:hypothetical protein
MLDASLILGTVSLGKRSIANPARTLQATINAASANSIVLVRAGQYDEEVVIPRAKSGLVLVGLQGRGAAYIEPEASEEEPDKTGLINYADDVTIINLGVAGQGTGSALVNYGSRFRADACKIEGGTTALKLTLGTVAQIDAGTHGKGADLWLIDCEVCWSTKGVEIVASDYGAVSQVRFRRCTFHDNTAADFEEFGASADIHYRDLDIGECVFLRQEDGTEPTKYLSLNDDNGNKGAVHGCVFPTALNSGKNLVSTGLIWVGNYHPAGLSTTQPS